MAKGLRLSQALVFGLVLSSLVCNAAAVFSNRNKDIRNSPPPEEEIREKESVEEGMTQARDNIYYYNLKTGEATWQHPKLIDGWFMALDEDTGRSYFYKEDGTAQWDVPDGIDWQVAAYNQPDL